MLNQSNEKDDFYLRFIEYGKQLKRYEKYLNDYGKTDEDNTLKLREHSNMKKLLDILWFESAKLKLLRIVDIFNFSSYHPELENFYFFLKMFYMKKPYIEKSMQLKLDESIVMPGLNITQTEWAVSYMKMKYSSGSIAPEHSFLLIQGHRLFERAELIVGKEGIEIKIHQKIKYINIDELKIAYKKILHMHEWNDAYSLDDNPPANPRLYTVNKQVCEETWLVSRDMIDDLIDECRSDRDKPPLYSLLGPDSIFELHNLFNKISKNSGIAASLTTAAVMGCYVIKSAILPLATSALASSLSTSSFSLAGLSAIGCSSSTPGVILCSAASGLGVSAAGSATYGIKHRNEPMPNGKIHNCDSWAKEKLRNMNVTDINIYLDKSKPSKLGNLPSISLGNWKEAFTCLITLAGQIRNRYLTSKAICLGIEKNEKRQVNELTSPTHNEQLTSVLQNNAPNNTHVNLLNNQPQGHENRAYVGERELRETDRSEDIVHQAVHSYIKPIIELNNSRFF